MIGSDELKITGVTTAGERVPVLRHGAWQDLTRPPTRYPSRRFQERCRSG